MDAQQGRVRLHGVLTCLPHAEAGTGLRVPCTPLAKAPGVGVGAARAPGNEAVGLGMRGDPPRPAPGLWVRCGPRHL